LQFVKKSTKKKNMAGSMSIQLISEHFYFRNIYGPNFFKETLKLREKICTYYIYSDVLYTTEIKILKEYM